MIHWDGDGHNLNKSNIRALVLLNLLNRILHLSLNSFIKFNKHEHSCKSLHLLKAYHVSIMAHMS